MTTARPDTFVLYDGACPVCASYMALAALRSVRGDVAVLDARKEPGLVAALRAQGHDVNNSILVGIGPRIFAGAEATRLIAELGSANGFARRAALRAISGGRFGAAIYPWQRACRKALLWLLGRPQIG